LHRPIEEDNGTYASNYQPHPLPGASYVMQAPHSQSDRWTQISEAIDEIQLAYEKREDKRYEKRHKGRPPVCGP
tara:strand:- start:827 stop:1048 length:222 start_codon:yes stop_codon:yes gene_type:complete